MPPTMQDIQNAGNVLFHYTCQYHLNSIFDAGKITTTESNFSLEESGLYPVVWLTSSLSPDNMGLNYVDGIPPDIDKTRIRLTILKSSNMIPWDEWSKKKGMDEQARQVLIETADASKQSYTTWWVSSRNIPVGRILYVEDLHAGKVIYSIYDKINILSGKGDGE